MLDIRFDGLICKSALGSKELLGGSEKVTFSHCTFKDFSFDTRIFKNISFEYCLFSRCIIPNLFLSQVHLKTCGFDSVFFSNLTFCPNVHVEDCHFNKCHFLDTSTIEGPEGLNLVFNKSSFNFCTFFSSREIPLNLKTSGFFRSEFFGCRGIYPEIPEGDFIGYFKTSLRTENSSRRSCLVKCLVPEKARRAHSRTQIEVSEARILSIWNIADRQPVYHAESIGKSSLKYQVGALLKTEHFNNPDVSHYSRIFVYLNKREALNRGC